MIRVLGEIVAIVADLASNKFMATVLRTAQPHPCKSCKAHVGRSKDHSARDFTHSQWKITGEIRLAGIASPDFTHERTSLEDS